MGYYRLFPGLAGQTYVNEFDDGQFDELSIAARGADKVEHLQYLDDVFIHGKDIESPASIDVDVEFDGRKVERIDSDFLTLGTGLIPLVSKRFVDTMPVKLIDDMELIPARLHLEGGAVMFFAIRFTRYRTLVDPDNSAFSEFAQGRIKILTKPRFVRQTDEFYLARDAVFPRVFVATDLMIAEIEKHNLNIEHLPY